MCARGEAFYPTPRGGHLRLSFGAHPPGELEQAAELLGQILTRLEQRGAQLRQRTRLRANPLV